jgi:hypothetical protein
LRDLASDQVLGHLGGGGPERVNVVEPIESRQDLLFQTGAKLGPVLLRVHDCEFGRIAERFQAVPKALFGGRLAAPKDHGNAEVFCTGTDAAAGEYRNRHG